MFLKFLHLKGYSNFHCRYRVVAMISLVTLLSACQQESTKQASVIPEVKVITVATAPVRVTSILPGRISASEVSEVRPQVDGIIVERLFEEGEFVKEGQALYRLDDEPYLAKVANSQAALVRAKAAIASTSALAERYRDLLKINAISKQDFENAVMQAEQAQADVLLQEAALRSAKVELSRTTITAPISGTIGRSIVTVGGLVLSGQALPLSTIQRLDPIFVDISQSSVELLKFRKAAIPTDDGQFKTDELRASLILEDGTIFNHEGTVKFTDVTVDPSTNSQVIRIQYSNPNRLLLPGMYVRAELNNNVVPSAVLVPQRAVGRDEKGNGTVLVVSQENKLESRKLITNRTVGESWIVTSGLHSGDVVVIEGASGLMPGTKVKTVTWTSTESQSQVVTALDGVNRG